jgi:hypothetical protein
VNVKARAGHTLAEAALFGRSQIIGIWIAIGCALLISASSAWGLVFTCSGLALAAAVRAARFRASSRPTSNGVRLTRR